MNTFNAVTNNKMYSYVMQNNAKVVRNEVGGERRLFIFRWDVNSIINTIPKCQQYINYLIVIWFFMLLFFPENAPFK